MLFVIRFSPAGMPLNILGFGAGGGCGIGFGLGWGFGSAYGSQYRSSRVTFQGLEFGKDDRRQNELLPFRQFNYWTLEKLKSISDEKQQLNVLSK
ncbi:hypothetical protein Gohar_027833, partial [Gossypium harknessii]|nr:hypothetical protein [Gossypium harknessii]